MQLYPSLLRTLFVLQRTITYCQCKKGHLASVIALVW
jgi:hypothetical protein